MGIIFIGIFFKLEFFLNQKFIFNPNYSHLVPFIGFFFNLNFKNLDYFFKNLNYFDLDFLNLDSFIIYLIEIISV